MESNAIKSNGDTTIDLGNILLVKTISDASLKAAQDSIQFLISKLFLLPKVSVDNVIGHLVDLPESQINFPRSKKVPKPKELTKQQKFAQQRGIQKKKKDKIAYDEKSGEWKRTYGYKRANDEADQWVIEHKDGADLSIDPFTQMDIDKKERVRKNKEKQRSNIVAARGDRIPGTIDIPSAIKASGSISQGRKESRAIERKRKGAHKSEHLDKTLHVAQNSTASMGLFDELHSDEPRIVPFKSKKKSGITSETYNIADENSQNLSILDQVIGKAPKESDFLNKSKAVNRLQVDAEAKNIIKSDHNNKRHKKLSHKKRNTSRKFSKKQNGKKRKRK